MAMAAKAMKAKTAEATAAKAKGMKPRTRIMKKTPAATENEADDADALVDPEYLQPKTESMKALKSPAKVNAPQSTLIRIEARAPLSTARSPDFPGPESRNYPKPCRH